MISLRGRIALLLGTAILGVAIAAAAITAQIVQGTHDGSLERIAARQSCLVSRLLGGSAERAREVGLEVGDGTGGRRSDPDATRIAREVFAAQGCAGEPVVLVGAHEDRQIAFPLAGGRWARGEFVDFPPSPIPPLLAYLSLVAAGALALSLGVAARLLGPMRMMERALHSVRADGTLPPIPEHGPPEVRGTARALNALSGRLATAMESRMRLVAAAGHDLRTPMTRLRLRAEFLPDGEREIWLRDLAELDGIADSAIRLVREEADTASFETLRLDVLLREIARELAEIGLPARVENGEPVRVRAQPLALKRALRNLAENAARHGGGAAMAARPDGEGSARVVIEDRGPGIPENQLGRVFEPFFRVDAGRRKLHPGAGLGLAIAREIVERQGGRITLGNREGGGLRQEIRLPGTGD